MSAFLIKNGNASSAHLPLQITSGTSVFVFLRLWLSIKENPQKRFLTFFYLILKKWAWKKKGQVNNKLRPLILDQMEQTQKVEMEVDTRLEALRTGGLGTEANF